MSIQFKIHMLIFLVFLGACSNTQTLPDGTEVTCQPVYGNWCGKGYPADSYMASAKPVDDWDEACRTHDFCYDEANGSDSALNRCDSNFANELESIANHGVPVPRQISNAYNVFRDNLPYRSIFVSWGDLFDATNLDCRGIEGKAATFCNCGNYWYQTDGQQCICQGPPVFDPYWRRWVPSQYPGDESSTNDY